ncbi:MAG: fibronectin type III domain-containing protein, partial [Elusimicrobiota bacterium]
MLKNIQLTLSKNSRSQKINGLLAVLFVLLQFKFAYGSPISIGTTVAIPKIDTSGLSGQKDSVIFRATSGTMFVMYSTGTALVYKTLTTNNGTDWNASAETTISTAAQTTDLFTFSGYMNPATNDVYVTYYSGGVKFKKLTYNSSPESWSVPSGNGTDVVSGTKYRYPNVICEDGGNGKIWVAYYNRTTSIYSLEIKYSGNGGDTWNIPITLITQPSDDIPTRPKLFLFGNKLGCSFISTSGSTALRWCWRNNSDSETTWAGAVEQIKNYNCKSDYSIAVTTDNYVWVAYYSGDTNSIRVSSYSSSGGWSAAETTISDNYCYNPSLTTDGTNLWLFWQKLNTTTWVNDKIYYKKYTSTATSWDALPSAPVPLSSGGLSFDKVFIKNESESWFDRTPESEDVTTGDVRQSVENNFMLSLVDDEMYFGKISAVFNDIYYHLSEDGSNGIIAWEYWNGSDWGTVSGVVNNFTSSKMDSVAGNGCVRINLWNSPGNIPSNWATTSVNGDSAYWVRAKVQTSYGAGGGERPIGDQFVASKNNYTFVKVPPKSPGIIPMVWLADSATYYCSVMFDTVIIDTIAPAGIIDFSAVPGPIEGKISLSWTAVGDDGSLNDIVNGKYWIKYSSVSTAVWGTAEYEIKWTTSTSPGNPENLELSGLIPGTTYLFWIETADEVPNWSAISNSTSTWAQVDVSSPAIIVNATAATGPTEGQIVLRWESPGDDEWEHTLIEGSAYQIKYTSDSLVGDPLDVNNYTIDISTKDIEPYQWQTRLVTGLTGGVTYYFWLQTADEATNWSGFSVRISSVSRTDITPPAAVTCLSALTGVGEGEIDLTWTSPGDDGWEHNLIAGSGYWLRWKRTLTPPLSWDDYDPGSEVFLSTETAPKLPQAHTVTGLASGSTYYFQLKTCDEVPNWSTGTSNTAFAWAQLDFIQPAQITTLTALTGAFEGRINLSWTDTGDNGLVKNITDGWYELRRTTNPSVNWNDSSVTVSSWLIPNTYPGNVVNWPLAGLTNGVTYYFWVRIADEVPLWSPISDKVTSWAQIDVSSPTTVQNLAGTTISEGTVRLTWSSPSDNDTTDDSLVIGGPPFPPIGRYYIEYTTDELAYWGDLGNSTTDWAVGQPIVPYGTSQNCIITGLTNETTYYFWIKTKDEVPNLSELSNKATVYVYADIIPPAVVTNLSALTGATEGQVQLSWSIPGDNGWDGVLPGPPPLPGSQFKIQYSTWPNYEDIVWSTNTAQETVSTSGVTPMTQVSFTVGSLGGLLTPDVTYYFKIWHCDEIPNWSTGTPNIAFARVQTDVTAPAAVTNLSALTGAVEGQIKLSWSIPGDDVLIGALPSGSEFKIQYSTWVGVVWSTTTATNQVTISTDSVTPTTLVGHTLNNLIGGTTYYFRIWHHDEVPNWSGLSNAATAWVQVDVTAPASVTNLSALTGAIEGQVQLSWSMPGDNEWDDALSSPGSEFKVQYSTWSGVV